jgi:hypothetical protein
MHRSILLLAVAAALATSGIAAATSGGSRPPRNPVEVALRKNAAVTSQRFSLRVVLTATKEIVPGVTTVPITGSGVSSTDPARARLTLSLGAIGAALGITPGITILLIDETLYVGLPPKLAAQLSGGKPWIKFDSADVSSVPGVGDVGDTSSLGPAQLLALFRGASSTKRTGTGVVRKIRCTKYLVTVDLERLKASLPASQQTLVASVIKAVGKPTVPMTVWIGNDGYVHRVSLSLPAVTFSGQTFSVALSSDLWDFGVTVRVKTPRTRLVADGSTVLQTILSSATGG